MGIRTDEKRCTMLKGLDLFASCTKKELARISSLCYVLSSEKGTTLTRQGAYGDEFFVIIEGQATASRNGWKIATLERGNFFGEMALLDCLGPNSAPWPRWHPRPSRS